MVKNPPAKVKDMVSNPSPRRSPGEENVRPLQYSCLENPMDREPGRLQSMGLHRIGYDLMTEQTKQKCFGI